MKPDLRVVDSKPQAAEPAEPPATEPQVPELAVIEDTGIVRRATGWRKLLHRG